MLSSLTEVEISPDALRMRVRRLCEKKVSGRCNVTPEIREDYLAGGEAREIIELALLEALAKHGVQRSSYKKVKDFTGQRRSMHFSVVSLKNPKGESHQMICF